MVEIANWYRYSSEACELIRENVLDKIEINMVTCGLPNMSHISAIYLPKGSPRVYWIVQRRKPVAIVLCSTLYLT
jgi:hypothetical protein